MKALATIGCWLKEELAIIGYGLKELTAAVFAAFAALFLIVFFGAILSGGRDARIPATTAYVKPEPTVEMTCKEGVIDELEDAIKSYDEATYKAKRDAGEKLALAAKAVSEGCAETEQMDYDPRD
jgi:hypothetical protein